MYEIWMCINPEHVTRHFEHKEFFFFFQGHNIHYFTEPRRRPWYQNGKKVSSTEMNNSLLCITYNLDSIGFVLLRCDMVPSFSLAWTYTLYLSYEVSVTGSLFPHACFTCFAATEEVHSWWMSKISLYFRDFRPWNHLSSSQQSPSKQNFRRRVWKKPNSREW